MNNFNLNNNLYNRIRNLFISLSLNKNFIGKIDTKTKREFVQNYFDKVKKFCEDKFKVDLSKYDLLPFDEYDKYNKYFKEKLGHPLTTNIACAFPLKSSAYINKYPIELKGKIVLNPHYEYTSGINNIPTIICHELGHSVYAELYGLSHEPHNTKFQNIIEIIYKGMMAFKELGKYRGSFYIHNKKLKLTKELIEEYIDYLKSECTTNAGNICLAPVKLWQLNGIDLKRAVISNYLVSEIELNKNLFNCSYAKSPISLAYLIKTKDKFISELYKLVGKELPVLSLNG